MTRLSTVISFALHALALSTLALSAAKCKGGGLGTAAKPGAKGEDVGKFDQSGREKDEKTKIVIREVSLVQKKSKECKSNRTYGGIGIYQNENGFIVEAPTWYPGYRAGLRVGDLIWSTDEIRGTPGTSVTVQVYREDKLLRYHIVRETICTTGKPEEERQREGPHSTNDNFVP